MTWDEGYFGLGLLQVPQEGMDFDSTTSPSFSCAFNTVAVAALSLLTTSMLLLPL
jgi:hypothetical protein